MTSRIVLLTYFAYTLGAGNGQALYLCCYLLACNMTVMPVQGLSWSAVIDYHDC